MATPAAASRRPAPLFSRKSDHVRTHRAASLRRGVRHPCGRRATRDPAGSSRRSGPPVRRSVSLKPIALRLGLKRTTFLRRADLRLPLDPEYMGEGFAVLAELREQLAKIEAAAAAAEGEHRNGARAEAAARAEASSASDVPDSAADAASTVTAKTVRRRALAGPLDGMTLTARSAQLAQLAQVARVARLATTTLTPNGSARPRSTPSRTRTRRRRPASQRAPPSTSTRRSWPRSCRRSIQSRSTGRWGRSSMPQRFIRKQPRQAWQCRSSPRSGRCCDPSTSISVTRSCRLIRF